MTSADHFLFCRAGSMAGLRHAWVSRTQTRIARAEFHSRGGLGPPWSWGNDLRRTVQPGWDKPADHNYNTCHRRVGLIDDPHQLFDSVEVGQGPRRHSRASGIRFHMDRTFVHEFEPAAASPVAGNTAALAVQEIEDAGLKEVLQTPGATFGTWALLDRLLTSTGINSPFTFREPLGQAREVKVALSGLFGRFVARAYLERYMGLSVFAHLGRSRLTLDGSLTINIVRLVRGDLPDWVACASDLSKLTVAEAKGSHDPSGPAKALVRAWEQVRRVDISIGGRRATVKRVAIATRWSAAQEGPENSVLAVRDPVDEGGKVGSEDLDAINFSLLRMHVANLIQPLGHESLATYLRSIATSRTPRGRDHARANARQELDSASIHDVDGTDCPKKSKALWEQLSRGPVHYQGPMLRLLIR